MQLSVIYGDVSQTIADLLIGDSERRCAAILRLGGRCHRARKTKSRSRFPVTEDDLAGAANLSRNSVGTMLQRRKARGLVEQGYRCIAIRAPKALRAFVDGG